MKTPTMPPALVPTILHGVLVAPYVQPQAFVVQPGTNLREHITDMVGPVIAHQLGVCACPFWHVRSDETRQWYVERTCGKDRVYTSQAPTRPTAYVSPHWAEYHAADVARRLNAMYRA